jgi:hypothetical protein
MRVKFIDRFTPLRHSHGLVGRSALRAAENRYDAVEICWTYTIRSLRGALSQKGPSPILAAVAIWERFGGSSRCSGRQQQPTVTLLTFVTSLVKHVRARYVLSCFLTRNAIAISFETVMTHVFNLLGDLDSDQRSLLSGINSYRRCLPIGKAETLPLSTDCDQRA